MSLVDIDHLRQWVGKQYHATDDITLFQARALAAALDHSRLPENGDQLPPSWHWLYFLETPSAANTGSDGHAINEAGFLPPAPLPRRMWAAGKLLVEQPLRIGAPAQKKSSIKSIDLKTGKSGSLVFVNVEHTLSQHGQLCIREEQNLVYRELPTAMAPLPAGEIAAAPATWVKKILPDPVFLFRYSALTYNGHRIHYDRDYATRTEFYPALVVHGPLLATLLLELVMDHEPDVRIASFDFRAVRPTFDSSPLTVNGQRKGDEIDLWTADGEGVIGMTARARVVQK